MSFSKLKLRDREGRYFLSRVMRAEYERGRPAKREEKGDTDL
jgi:hypothetical protein